jgi:predicted transcriptional regulator YdeE
MKKERISKVVGLSPQTNNKFELYDKLSRDPENTYVDIYLGII